MFKNSFILILLILLMNGCAVKAPVTWEKRILKSEGNASVPLSYTEYGSKANKTLLFLHGFGESKETWRFLVPKLSQKYHLVLVDLKGFGISPKIEDGAYSVYDQAKVVANFIKEKNYHDLTVVGRSFGGGVTLVLALMQHDKLIEERISKLILINSISYRQNLPSMLKTLNKPLIGYLGIHLVSNDWMAEEAYRFAFYNNKLIPKESVEYASYVLSTPLAKYVYLETVDQLIPDDIVVMQKRYKEIRLKTLILWGKEDVSISVRNGYKLHRDLRNSRLKVFDKVGHLPNEEAPQKVVFEILKFMKEDE